MPILSITSSKQDGNMSYKLGPKEIVDENQRRFFEKHKINSHKLVEMIQVHGNRIGVVKRSQIRRNTDGLITKTPNLWLVVYHADCIPLFFIDETTPAIGIAHVGWKGAVAGLPAKMVHEMVKHFKTDPKNLKVKFGPFICEHHYDVAITDERVKLLPHTVKDGKAFINLRQAVSSQLVSVGVLSSNILTSNSDCTAQQPEKYWSHHKLRDERQGGMISVIGFIN